MGQQKIPILQANFSKNLCDSCDFLGKVIERIERSFYPPLFRNSLESWQKREYPLSKVIAFQKHLPVTKGMTYVMYFGKCLRKERIHTPETIEDENKVIKISQTINEE